MKSLARVLSGRSPWSRGKHLSRNVELLETHSTITTGSKRTIWCESWMISQSARHPYPGQFSVLEPEFTCPAVEEHKTFRDGFENLHTSISSVTKRLGILNQMVLPERRRYRTIPQSSSGSWKSWLTLCSFMRDAIPAEIVCLKFVEG